MMKKKTTGKIKTTTTNTTTTNNTKSSSKSSPTLLKQAKAIAIVPPPSSSNKREEAKKKAIVQQEREQAWYIPPSAGIPSYHADKDPYCPAARVRKFNEEQRQRVERESAFTEGVRSEQWISASLDRQYTQLPLKNIHDFRAKASDHLMMSSNGYGYGYGGSNGSVGGGVQTAQPVGRPFLFKGYNYLIKMKTDLDFIDQYDVIVERVCFEFQSNPLAYRGGGRVIQGFELSATATNSLTATSQQRYQNLLSAYHQSLGDDGAGLVVDGLPVSRLRRAEEVIQGEFRRIQQQVDMANSQQQRSALQQQLEQRGLSFDQYDNSGEDGVYLSQPGGRQSIAQQTLASYQDLRASWESAASFDPLTSPTTQQQQQGESFLRLSVESGDSVTSNINEGNQKKKSSAKINKKNLFNPKRAKLERITVLQEETSELEAMIAHIHDKITTLSGEVKIHAQRAAALLKKEQEARENGREGAALHIAAEISLTNATILEKRTAIKDLHREAYFLSLERKRKQGVVKTMQDEMTLHREREKLKKKIEAKIKKDGLMAALAEFDSEKLTLESLKLNSSSPPRKGNGKGSDKNPNKASRKQSMGSVDSRVSLAEEDGPRGGGDGVEEEEEEGEGKHEDEMAAYNKMLEMHDHIEDLALNDSTDHNDDGNEWKSGEYVGEEDMNSTYPSGIDVAQPQQFSPSNNEDFDNDDNNDELHDEHDNNHEGDYDNYHDNTNDPGYGTTSSSLPHSPFQALDTTAGYSNISDRDMATSPWSPEEDKLELSADSTMHGLHDVRQGDSENHSDHIFDTSVGTTDTPFPVMKDDDPLPSLSGIATADETTNNDLFQPPSEQEHERENVGLLLEERAIVHEEEVSHSPAALDSHPSPSAHEPARGTGFSFARLLRRG
eukprot:scaffold367_cov274-Ochromonas_danica.AAC.11